MNKDRLEGSAKPVKGGAVNGMASKAASGVRLQANRKADMAWAWA